VRELAAEDEPAQEERGGAVVPRDVAREQGAPRQERVRSGKERGESEKREHAPLRADAAFRQNREILVRVRRGRLSFACIEAVYRFFFTAY